MVAKNAANEHGLHHSLRNSALIASDRARRQTTGSPPSPGDRGQLRRCSWSKLIAVSTPLPSTQAASEHPAASVLENGSRISTTNLDREHSTTHSLLCTHAVTDQSSPHRSTLAGQQTKYQANTITWRRRQTHLQRRSRSSWFYWVSFVVHMEGSLPVRQGVSEMEMTLKRPEMFERPWPKEVRVNGTTRSRSLRA